MKKVLYLLAGAVIWSLLSTTGSSAASLSDFRAGNIISNEMMSNKVTMSEVQIQNFLKSKVVCNSTGGGYINQLTISPDGRTASLPGYSATWNIKNGRFVCMADDTFNGETAAHIIWQAAQDYNINPQVLIVLLQKESGLITDDFPNSIQYRSATGYGCPDTAPCDAQYYGLKNQVRRAAGLFNEVLTGGWTNYPLGNNTILYNPDRSCGSSVVNIQNLATSALYRYTPYQPNPATLAAPWGSTVSCGAYGNSNFFMYFTTWFGSTTYNGKAVRSDTNGSGVYLIENGIKRAFDSVDALYSHNYSWDKVITISSSLLNSMPSGPAVGINIAAYTGKLIKSNSPSSGVYIVDNTSKRPFDSAEAFNSYGYDWGKIITVSDAVMADIPIGPPIGINVSIYNKKAIRENTASSGVYLIENGIKRAFDSVDALYSHNYSWDKVLTVSSTTIASIPTGPALGINIDAYTGRLLKSNAPNSGIYLVESFVRRPFESAAAFNSYGYDWGKIITVSDAVMADIPIGPPIGIR